MLTYPPGEMPCKRLLAELHGNGSPPVVGEIIVASIASSVKAARREQRAVRQLDKAKR